MAPGETYIMPTGVAYKLPEQHVGIIKARSSLAMNGLTIDGGFIDEGYIGEIQVILVNRNKWIDARRSNRSNIDNPANNRRHQGGTGAT